MSGLSWVAVRRGPVFCAPACGFSCTHAAFRLANKRAAALAKRLGPGWAPHVWENCGWHYSAIGMRGLCKVHGRDYGESAARYTAFLGVDKQAGGRWTGQSISPRKAVALAVAGFSAEMGTMESVAKAVRS